MRTFAFQEKIEAVITYGLNVLEATNLCGKLNRFTILWRGFCRRFYAAFVPSSE